MTDLVVAAMTELPTSKQWRADQISAVRGTGPGGIVAESVNVLTGERAPLAVRPSRAVDFQHGFASLVKFFPDGKALTAQIEEALWDRLHGRGRAATPVVFDDQYLATGGQIYELLTGRDRMVGDLRPLVLPALGYHGAMTCHPYDICTGFLLTEGGRGGRNARWPSARRAAGHDDARRLDGVRQRKRSPGWCARRCGSSASITSVPPGATDGDKNFVFLRSQSAKTRVGYADLLMHKFVPLFLVALFLGGCHRRETPVESGNREQIFHLGNGSEPRDLDPHISSSTTESNILCALFEGLVNNAPDGHSVVPGAAERWDVSPDGRVYTFHLRPGLKWSNGDPD